MGVGGDRTGKKVPSWMLVIEAVETHVLGAMQGF